MQAMSTVNIAHRVVMLTLLFVAMIVIHSIAMMLFEDMDAGNALWVTLTTVTTVGYGDLSAQTLEGRAATVVLLYFGGIFILARIAGDYFEFRAQRRALMHKGLWRWNMQDHIVIINTPSSNVEEYFTLLVTQIRQIPEFTQLPIQILTPKYPLGLPETLLKHDVVHYTGSADDGKSFAALSIDQAKHIIVLSRDEHDRVSDSITYDILHRLRELKTSAKILVECVADENRERFYTAGANAVVRPIRAYPELLVRAIAAPGTEKVLENLFTHGGNHTQRYDVRIDNLSWSQVVCALINNNLGTALAYIDENGFIVTDPSSDQPVFARGLILLVREQHLPTESEIQAALAQYETSAA